MKQSTADLRD